MNTDADGALHATITSPSQNVHSGAIVALLEDETGVGRQHGQASLYALDAGGFCPFADPDLLHSELSSANAATPARRCGGGDYRHWLPIRAPGSHQFATAPLDTVVES